MSARDHWDEQDDEATDEQEREYVRRRTEEDNDRDHAQAERAMSTSAIIASGNASILDAVTGALSRKAV
jgi:hypothetical protein